MTDQHCTSDAYGNTGCIGTAVHTHSTIGDLPMTGFDIVSVLATVLGALLLSYVVVRAVAEAQELGVMLPRFRRDRHQRGGYLHVPPTERIRDTLWSDEA